MKKLQALREFQIKPTTTKLVIGGASSYYCWTDGEAPFAEEFDSDLTGETSETGSIINCTAVAVVSAKAPKAGAEH